LHALRALGFVGADAAGHVWDGMHGPLSEADLDRKKTW
jgi:hypothetical protein